jgi:hypothetical protein
MRGLRPLDRVGSRRGSRLISRAGAAGDPGLLRDAPREIGSRARETRWVVPGVRCVRTAACRHAPFAIVMRRAVTGRSFTPLDRSPAACGALPCSGALPRLAPYAALPWASAWRIVSPRITLNRDPHARLARLADEPPAARDECMIRAMARCGTDFVRDRHFEGRARELVRDRGPLRS